MASLNKVMIIGTLGRDPELKYTSGGMPMANLNIATNESYTDRDGNKVDRTEWHRVTVFQRQAENCSTYLRKGSQVYVEGSLQTRKWQDAQGVDRYTTEIRAQRVQFLDRRGENRNDGPWGEEAGRAPGAKASHAPIDNMEPDREDLGSPFPSEAVPRDEVPF